MTTISNSSPVDALDYPHLDDNRWVLWHGNEFIWPSASRETHYLSATRRDVMKGYVLFTPDADQARTFASEPEAREWLAEQEALRPHPYGVNITTVADLKRQRGYAA